MELAMLMMAVLGYALFQGFPLRPGQATKAVKTLASESQSEEEIVSKELQTQLAEGNHRMVYKLWQRAKSFDVPSGVPLSGIVDSMQKLGKTTEAILREFRSAMECNDALFSNDGAQTLLESLRKDGQNPELVDGLVKIFAITSKGHATASRSPKVGLMSLEGALQGGRLDEALSHLERP